MINFLINRMMMPSVLIVLLTGMMSIALVPQAYAQEQPLAIDPGNDQFEFCKRLYRQANNLNDQVSRMQAYQRLIPRLRAYVENFPNHANTPAATYYLGECYYHSGNINEGKRIFHSVVNRFKKGRYVALASNRLGYDAMSNKKYAQAAIYFGRVANLSTNAQERFRGRYQEAGCLRLAGKNREAMRAYNQIEQAENAPAVYREHARLRLGYLYRTLKQPEKALVKFESLLMPGVEESMQVEASLQAGLLSLDLKKTEEANRYLKSVLSSAQDKFKPRAQAALMSLMYEKKNYQGVLNALQNGNYPGSKSMESAKYLLAGRSAYKLSRFHEAIKLLAKAERQLPGSQQAFDAAYFRLLCFFKIEGANIPMQVDVFLEIHQKRYPRHERVHKALLMKAETLYDQRKFREAAGAYNQIESSLVGEKNIANLLFKRAWCLSESGDHNGAVRNFTNFINKAEEDPRMPKAIARRAESFQALGDRVSAMKDYDMLIKRYPKEKLAALAWQNTARIRKKDQDYQDMIRRYREMLKGFPSLRKGTLANAHYWIGWGEYQLKNYEKAIAPLQKSRELAPEEYGFNASMLTVYSAFAMKDKTSLEDAIQEVRKLGKGSKIQPAVYRWLGVQCFNAGEMKKAERFLTLGVTPVEPLETPKIFWKMLGKARVETGKYERALEAINNYLAVVQEPFSKVEALLDQSEAYLGLNKLADAQKSAEEGLALRPKGKVNAELRVNLGDIAYSKKDYGTAAGHYVVVVQIFPDDKDLRPEALFKSYQALNKKGDAKEAQRYLDLLNREFPKYLKKK